MSYHPPHVPNTSHQAAQTRGYEGPLGGQYHTHSNAFATPILSPYTHASRPREPASNAVSPRTSSMSHAYGTYGEAHTPPVIAASYGSPMVAPPHASSASPQWCYPAARTARPSGQYSGPSDMHGSRGEHLARYQDLYGGIQRPSGSAAHVVPGFGMPRMWSMPSRASISPRSATVPPIHRLPAEILSQIFIHATEERQLFLTTLHSRRPALVISQVCGYWRDVAVDLPELWKRVSLTACPSRNQHRSRKLARTFMRRTKGTGMDVYYRDAEAVTIDDHYFEVVALRRPVIHTPAEDRCFCVLDMIRDRIAEMRTLELVIGHASSLRLSSLPALASSLQTLRVEFMEGGAQVQNLSTMLSSSPQLRHLSWRSHWHVCAVPPPAGVPWSQLVCLYIEESPMGFDVFFDMMTVGHALEDLWVYLRRESPSPMPPHPRISQFVLKHFTIFGDGPLDEVFHTLHIPSVRDFSLKSEPDSPAGWPCSDPQTFSHFISTGTTALDVFHIMEGGTIHEDALLAVLALPQMSTLTSLDVVLTSVGDKLVERLHPGRNATLLPHLAKLTFGACAATDGTIARMLRARHQHGYPLRNIHAEFMRSERGRHPLDEAEFRRLHAFGILARGAC